MEGIASEAGNYSKDSQNESQKEQEEIGMLLNVIFFYLQIYFKISCFAL